MTVDIGQLAPNLEPEFTQWRTGEGDAAEWTLVADANAEGGRAIAQVSKDKTNYRFPLAIYRPFSGKDLEVLVRFKPVAGTVDQAGGIAVRLQTPDDYYVVRANALDNSVRFYRVEKGKRSQVAGKETPVESDKWHSLRVIASNESFEVSLDGNVLFSANDRSLPQPGAVGVWSQADSVTRYGSLLVGPVMK